MIELHSNDWFTIRGRGLMASVNLREIVGCPERIDTWSDMPVHRGMHVLIDGDEYEIRDIEYVRALVYPPFIKPDVCLLVRPSALAQQQQPTDA